MLKGRATEEEPNVIFGRAENVDVKSVIAVLRAPGVPAATMGTTVMKYPQQGRAAAVQGFTKRCNVVG